MHNIIKTRKIWFSISGVFMLISIIALLTSGLKLGIDFTGGSLLEIKYENNRPSISQIEESLGQVNIHNIKVQPSDDNIFLIRFENVDEDKHQIILNQLTTTATDSGLVEEQRFESIGPTIGAELKSKSIEAIVIVLIFIVVYIAYAFRHVSKPVASWKYGLAAIVALVHDILIITGIFAILGYLLGVEVDSLFVTALLTILGFSVHDTIVTFDRIRENLFKIHNQSFEDIVNLSVNQTIVRSINTSFTTLLVLLAIYIFGGQSIKYFVLALMLGLIIGTYSSIFIASPLLVWWNKKS